MNPLFNGRFRSSSSSVFINKNLSVPPQESRKIFASTENLVRSASPVATFNRSKSKKHESHEFTESPDLGFVPKLKGFPLTLQESNTLFPKSPRSKSNSEMNPKEDH